MNINVYFGNKIKEERLKLNLSQEKLALEADVDRTYVNDIEKGSRNVSLVIAFKLSKALNIPLSNLLKELK
ncbi:helix-turn-helix transcriptional regulator [Oceanihabitans sediminis]|uniref:helix-turn-helix transcriptional regulator n=1 Tax=Oceanihabitans sediminis TaxID=1812012 RepID=UPI00299CFD0E|nr:helix-turn-helix transcriptional regulator [Oceanihabitans sediminis]MDX1774020.1 helix-turn-helix transcriptional regulator [Oceanihabitans sediminis]